jgi:6-phosphogluconolactonase
MFYLPQARPALPALLALLLSACGGGGAPSTPAAAPPAEAFVFVAGTGAGDGGSSIATLLLTGSAAFQPNAVSAGSAPAGRNTVSLAAHPSGTFLYAANFSSRDASVYSIDPARGRLTGVQTLSLGEDFFPTAVTLHPSGQLALFSGFSAGPVKGKVRAFSLDAHSGRLTPAGSEAAVGVTPAAMAMAPSGKFAYVIDSFSGTLWVLGIDALTGELSDLSGERPSPTGDNPMAIAVTGSGRFAYVANAASNDVSAFRLGAATGTVAPLLSPRVAAGRSPASIAVHPSDRFVYVCNAQSDDITVLSIDAATGQLTFVVNVPSSARGPKALSFNASGTVAMVISDSSSEVALYGIDPANGALTSSGSAGTGLAPGAIAVLAKHP